ncbi:Leucine-rich_repeat domain superfamily [Hexamita inflata]|uniref:Leucine-rich_repeat domain superfamily n=1 Tax=Hexamita inflata TaxID=28002 RepID=A0ABP1GI43_9EUKA
MKIRSLNIISYIQESNNALKNVTLPQTVIFLNVSNNVLKSLKCIENLFLTHLYANGNLICSLEPLYSQNALQALELNQNQLFTSEELFFVQDKPHLKHLSVERNPMITDKLFTQRLHVIINQITQYLFSGFSKPNQQVIIRENRRLSKITQFFTQQFTYVILRQLNVYFATNILKINLPMYHPKHYVYTGHLFLLIALSWCQECHTLELEEVTFIFYNIASILIVIFHSLTIFYLARSCCQLQHLVVESYVISLTRLQVKNSFVFVIFYTFLYDYEIPSL